MVKSKTDIEADREETTVMRPSKRMKLSDIGATNEKETVDDTGETTGDSQTAQETDNSEHGNKQGGAKQSTSRVPKSSSEFATAPVAKQGGGASQPTLSVRTIIPNPTKLLIDDAEVMGYTDLLKSRLQKLSDYANQKAAVYALGKLLPTATWGQYKPVNDRSKTLCDPATGEPLTIWVVGHIARKWFARNGVPESQASITILPLSQNLARQSAQLLAKFSNPTLPVNAQTTHNIRAIKWQNTKCGNDEHTDPMLFDAVYDARAEGSLKNYDERPVWNLADLKAGDLILLEMKMTRYSRKGEDNKWQSRAQYEMLAISLLNMGEAAEGDDQGMSKIDGLAI